MTIAQQEIFGPVLAMLPYDSEEVVIQTANDTPYGLAGYVQSATSTTRESLRIRAGMCISTVHRLVWMPSGTSSQHGQWGAHGFTDYLEIKAISGFEVA